jgi:hypothetical protein
VGAALLLPMLINWAQTIPWGSLRGANAKDSDNAALCPVSMLLIPLLACLLPVAAYVIFRQVMGHSFDLIQDQYFGRRFLNMIVNPAGVEWGVNNMMTAFRNPTENVQMYIYYLLEIASLILALVTCLFTLRGYLPLALFSLTVLVISTTSRAPQSLIR